MKKKLREIALKIEATVDSRDLYRICDFLRTNPEGTKMQMLSSEIAKLNQWKISDADFLLGKIYLEMPNLL